MFYIYCIVDPCYQLFLKKSSSKSLKSYILNAYKRNLKDTKFYCVYCDFTFTEDIRLCETFISRDVALKVCDVLSNFIPEDFRIGRLEYEML